VWFQEISITPPQRVIGNSKGEGGGLKGQKFLKESMSLNWKVQTSGGLNPPKKNAVGEYGYFLEQQFTLFFFFLGNFSDVGSTQLAHFKLF